MPETGARTRIAGGMFGLETGPANNPRLPAFFQSPLIYLLNARSGIWLVARHLRPEKAWIPSYLCRVVVDALSLAETPYDYYPVDRALAVSNFEWIEKIHPGDLVILIDYFGFRPPAMLFEKIHQKGAWILEDASQALLTQAAGEGADFCVFSPRKFLGVPDGGILTGSSGGSWQGVTLQPAPGEWWAEAFLAALLRRDFDRGGSDRRWFDLFRKTEPSSPTGYYAMSELSRVILHGNFDYEQAAAHRVRNYRFLLDEIRDFALFPFLDDGTVPLGFPVCMQNRDEVRNALFEIQVYPPLHWPIHEFIPSQFTDSLRLEAEIMTLPCDQRLEPGDLAQAIDIIKRTAKR